MTTYVAVISIKYWWREKNCAGR